MPYTPPSLSQLSNPSQGNKIDVTVRDIVKNLQKLPHQQSAERVSNPLFAPSPQLPRPVNQVQWQPGPGGYLHPPGEGPITSQVAPLNKQAGKFKGLLGAAAETLGTMSRRGASKINPSAFKNMGSKGVKARQGTKQFSRNAGVGGEALGTMGRRGATKINPYAFKNRGIRGFKGVKDFKARQGTKQLSRNAGGWGDSLIDTGLGATVGSMAAPEGSEGQGALTGALVGGLGGRPLRKYVPKTRPFFDYAHSGFMGSATGDVADTAAGMMGYDTQGRLGQLGWASGLAGRGLLSPKLRNFATSSGKNYLAAPGNALRKLEAAPWASALTMPLGGEMRWSGMSPKLQNSLMFGELGIVAGKDLLNEGKNLVNMGLGQAGLPDIDQMQAFRELAQSEAGQQSLEKIKSLIPVDNPELVMDEKGYPTADAMQWLADNMNKGQDLIDKGLEWAGLPPTEQIQAFRDFTQSEAGQQSLEKIQNAFPEKVRGQYFDESGFPTPEAMELVQNNPEARHEVLGNVVTQYLAEQPPGSLGPLVQQAAPVVLQDMAENNPEQLGELINTVVPDMMKSNPEAVSTIMQSVLPSLVENNPQMLQQFVGQMMNTMDMSTMAQTLPQVILPMLFNPQFLIGMFQAVLGSIFN